VPNAVNPPSSYSYHIEILTRPFFQSCLSILSSLLASYYTLVLDAFPTFQVVASSPFAWHTTLCILTPPHSTLTPIHLAAIMSLPHQLPTPTDSTHAADDMMDASLDTNYADSPTSIPNHSTSYTPIDSMTPISTNPSRKRSRDESAFDSADAEGSYFPSLQAQANPPAPIPEEPIYGEGMTLLNPSTGVVLSAESQTGTWYEEKADTAALASEVEAINAANAFRPKIPASRKSIRLSQNSIPSLSTFAVNQSTSSNTSAPASPPKTASSTSHPEIDEATLALGIGWTLLANEDENIQTAARGWARYLENHYARYIHNAEILLKSSGLNAYLVRSNEGFYLFSENLLEGRLVSREWERCISNLRSQPMMFEGEEILRAERTPGPDAGKGFEQGQRTERERPVTEKMENWADYNRLNNGDASGVVTNGVGHGHGEPGPAFGGGMEID
jgi:hypothetical protein